MELMKKIYLEAVVAIGTVIAIMLHSLAGGALLMVAWNAIALEFNLPQFSYWICFCVYYVIRLLTTKTVVADSKK